MQCVRSGLELASNGYEAYWAGENGGFHVWTSTLGFELRDKGFYGFTAMHTCGMALYTRWSLRGVWQRKAGLGGQIHFGSEGAFLAVAFYNLVFMVICSSNNNEMQRQSHSVPTQVKESYERLSLADSYNFIIC